MPRKSTKASTGSSADSSTGSYADECPTCETYASKPDENKPIQKTLTLSIAGNYTADPKPQRPQTFWAYRYTEKIAAPSKKRSTIKARQYRRTYRCLAKSRAISKTWCKNEKRHRPSLSKAHRYIISRFTKHFEEAVQEREERCW